MSTNTKRKGGDLLIEKALARYGAKLPVWASIQSRVNIRLLPGVNGEIVVISNDTYTPLSEEQRRELRIDNTYTIRNPPTRVAYVCYASPNDTCVATMCYWVEGTPYAEFEKRCKDELAWHMFNVEGSRCINVAREYCPWTLRVLEQ